MLTYIIAKLLYLDIISYKCFLGKKCTFVFAIYILTVKPAHLRLLRLLVVVLLVFDSSGISSSLVYFTHRPFN